MDTHLHFTSPALKKFITQFESERLSAYLCPANKLTIGIGHVLLPRDGQLFGVSGKRLLEVMGHCQGMRKVPAEYKSLLRITSDISDKLFYEDVRIAGEFLLSVTPVPLNQYQFEALVSFIFNVGQRQYAASTLKKLVGEGRFKEAADEFGRWVYGTVDGKKTKLAGLVRRREAERALFI